MENKYYTPTIEEFHVGFECEVETIANHKGIANGWEGVILCTLWFNSVDPTRISKSLIETSNVRVKYLDQADIESLGFKQDGDFNTVFYIVDKLVLQVIKDEVLIYTHKQEGKYSEHLFKGMIKNKSELKKVLKMIGYAG